MCIRDREKGAPVVKAAYVPVTRDGAPGIKATIGVRPASRNGFSVNNLYLTKTDSGWMITGADVENPLALDEQKKP